MGVGAPDDAEWWVIWRGCCRDEVLVAALRCMPFARRARAWEERLAHERLALPRQESRKLELVEVGGRDVGMAELNRSGREIVGDEQAGIAPAIHRIDAGARLRRGAGIGLRRASEPRRRRLRRLIGPKRARAKSPV